MADDSQQEASSNQIAGVMHEFMQIAGMVHEFTQLRIRFKASFPEELARLRDRLDKIHPKDRPHRLANYDLFYRMSHILYQKDNPTMGELSSVLSVPLSTATRMVDWLVDNGYATRLPDSEDRRIVRVALTDSGREIHKTIESWLKQRFRQILSCLTAEERTTLLALMGKIVSASEGIER